MFNLPQSILDNPGYFRQLSCRDSLISVYNCPLENKYEDTWSQYNYIVYVKEGRKIWHTNSGSWDLREGSCVLVRKGAVIVEQFFDVTFCLVLFFITDQFISEVLKTKSTPMTGTPKKFGPVIPIENNAGVQSFFQSMMPYFDAPKKPDDSLLELKFRELILTIADNPANEELVSFFSALQSGPQGISLQRVMEDNFCYNLKMEEYARLNARSLSAFKRDFQAHYKTTPGKWLTEKRLHHASHLLTNLGKTVAEAAFESGFENASHFSRAFRQRFGTSPLSMKQKKAI